MMYKVQKYRCALVRDGVQRFAYDKISGAEMARTVFTKLLRDLPHEELWALCLNGKHDIVGAVKISQGGAHGAALRPMDVFRPVLVSGATAFVIAHNHPSNDPTPSAADIEMTRLLIQGSELIGLGLLDHLIVTRSGGWRSLRDSMLFEGMGE